MKKTVGLSTLIILLICSISVDASAQDDRIQYCTNALIRHPQGDEMQRFSKRCTPVIVGRTNEITAYGEWLDITNKAELESKSDGSRKNLSYTTGNRNGLPYVKVTIPGNISPGDYSLFLDRPGANGLDEQRVFIDAVEDPYIERIEIVSAETNNVAYENAFKVGVRFLARVHGRNLDNLSFYIRQESNGARMDPPCGQTLLLMALSTPQLSTYQIHALYNKDKYEIMEGDFTINLSYEFNDHGTRYFAQDKINYSSLRNHNWNPNPFNYFRVYDKPNLSISLVENKVVFPFKNQEGCPALMNVVEGVTAVYPLRDPEKAIALFNLEAPSPPSNHTTKVVTWPDVKITLKNDSWAYVPPSNAQISLDRRVVAYPSMPAILANGSVTFSFKRPSENRKLLARHVKCPGVYELMVAPYDWRDPPMTLGLNLMQSYGYHPSYTF